MKNTSRVLEKEFAAGAAPIGCGSFERHRLLKLWWDSNRSQFKNARVLHFVPKDPIRKFAQELPNESFDLAICSDVPEHLNDKMILCELHRILSKNGALVTIVRSIDRKEPCERSAISDPKPRPVQVGRADRVKIYDADLRKRVLDAGFAIEEFTATASNTIRPLLAEKVFVCHK